MDFVYFCSYNAIEFKEINLMEININDYRVNNILFFCFVLECSFRAFQSVEMTLNHTHTV